MSYSKDNLTLVAGMVGQGPRIWMYTDTNSASNVDASGYFSDANLGLAAGDLIFVRNSTVNTWYAHTVAAVGTYGADLGDSTIIGVATNSD